MLLCSERRVLSTVQFTLHAVLNQLKIRPQLRLVFPRCSPSPSPVLHQARVYVQSFSTWNPLLSAVFRFVHFLATKSSPQPSEVPDCVQSSIKFSPSPSAVLCIPTCPLSTCITNRCWWCSSCRVLKIAVTSAAGVFLCSANLLELLNSRESVLLMFSPSGYCFSVGQNIIWWSC